MFSPERFARPRDACCARKARSPSHPTESYNFRSRGQEFLGHSRLRFIKFLVSISCRWSMFALPFSPARTAIRRDPIWLCPPPEDATLETTLAICKQEPILRAFKNIQRLTSVELQPRLRPSDFA